MANEFLFIEDDLRVKERQINEVLNLIEILDDSDEILTQDNSLFSPSQELINTLKGSIYLMLYNAVESTLRECIDTIHEVFMTQGVEFDCLQPSLKEEIINRISKKHRKISDITDDSKVPLSKTIHYTTFAKKNLFSGNIDREEVKNLSKIYGFDDNTDYHQTRHGETLRDIKVKRNDLAHGNITFSAVAQLKTVQELKDISSKTINYLDALIDNIDDYIQQKQFDITSTP